MRLNKKAICTIFFIVIMQILSHNSDEIIFRDPSFEKAIRNELGLANGPISKENMETISILNISDNSIKEITEIIYCKNLTILNCQNNEIEYLDLQNNFFLFQLNCSYNNIKELNIPEDNIFYINCSYNQLKNISLRGLKLDYVNLEGNRISFLDLESAPNTKFLNCSNNLLENLNISFLNKLQELQCQNNILQELNLPISGALTRINCSLNFLEKLKKTDCEHFIFYPQKNDRR